MYAQCLFDCRQTYLYAWYLFIHKQIYLVSYIYIYICLVLATGYTRPLLWSRYPDLATINPFESPLNQIDRKKGRTLSAAYRQRLSPARPRDAIGPQTNMSARQNRADRYCTPCRNYPPAARKVHPSVARTSSTYTKTSWRSLAPPPRTQRVRPRRHRFAGIRLLSGTAAATVSPRIPVMPAKRSPSMSNTFLREQDGEYTVPPRRFAGR